MATAGIPLLEADRVLSKAPPVPEQRGELRRTRAVFYFFAAYLLSQAFLIPIAAVGPRWVLWPTLSDLALLGMAACALTGSRSGSAPSAPQRGLLRSLLFVGFLCIPSYLMTVFLIGQPASGKAFGIVDGAYNLYRMIQFVLLYWLSIQIPLDEKRLRLLGWAVDIAFWVVCGSIFLTYFEVVRLGALTAHLPRDPLVAGNWSNFARLDKYPEVTKGLGTVSYTHAYGAIQVLMLLALRLHLWEGRRSLLAAAYVLVAILTTVLTESRAGLAAIILFASVYSLGNPKILLGGMIMAAIAAPWIDWRRMERSLHRQHSIVSATSDDNLSGRPYIWGNHLRSLRDNPLHVLIGGGLGSARVNGRGSNGHMLYLHVLSEAGVSGLLLFAALAWLVLRSLYRRDIYQKPLFWATVALLLSAMTQETFYPVPWTGHFIGFFLLCVAIALRKPLYGPKSNLMRRI